MSYNELKNEMLELIAFNSKTQKHIANQILNECTQIMRANDETSIKTIVKRESNAYSNLSCIYEIQEKFQERVTTVLQKVLDDILEKREKIRKIDICIGDYFTNDNKSLKEKFYKKYDEGVYIDTNEYLFFLRNITIRTSDVEYINYLYKKHILKTEIENLNLLSYKLLRTYTDVPILPELDIKAFNRLNIEKSSKQIRNFIDSH